MERPKSVNVFLLTFVGLVLLGLLSLSIYIQDFTFFFEAVGLIIVVVLGSAAFGLLMGTVMIPFVWLLSFFGGGRQKRKH